MEGSAMLIEVVMKAVIQAAKKLTSSTCALRTDAVVCRSSRRGGKVHLEMVSNRPVSKRPKGLFTERGLSLSLMV